MSLKNIVTKTFSMSVADLARITRLIVLSILFLWLSDWLPKAVGESLLSPILFSIGVAGMCWSFGHIVRKILQPRLDIQTIANKAVTDNSLPAAIVYLASQLWYIAVGIGIIIMVR